MKNKHKCFVCGKRINPRTCWYICNIYDVPNYPVYTICKRCFNKSEKSCKIKGYERTIKELGYEKEWNGKINGRKEEYDNADTQTAATKTKEDSN